MSARSNRTVALAAVLFGGLAMALPPVAQAAPTTGAVASALPVVPDGADAKGTQGKTGLKSAAGPFQIVALHSGKCADVNGDPWNPGSDGDNVAQWTCGNYKATNQLWYLEDAGGGSYYLKAGHSFKCMDVAGFSTENGGNVVQWNCHGGANQRWRISGQAWQENHNTFNLVSEYSGKCLDVEGVSTQNKANVHQWECLGYPQRNQRWYLNTV
ncbi:RICIN domain-containing protein [Streptomyces sp. NPDC048337]|uniref:RICIN domain-containing protein n=1 Tax=Streptomyces sp. NPDC048337 TaxID=3365535 RepID=UPI0037164BD1